MVSQGSCALDGEAQAKLQDYARFLAANASCALRDVTFGD